VKFVFVVVIVVFTFIVPTLALFACCHKVLVRFASSPFLMFGIMWLPGDEWMDFFVASIQVAF